MDKSSDELEEGWWKKNKISLISLGIFVGLICFLILWGVWIFPWLVCDVEERGQWGDSFGSINALFTGLAFACMFYAIRQNSKQLQQNNEQLEIQQEELKIQIEELQETRKEIRAQTKQLQAQDQTFRKQNFGSAFFQLLSLHNDIVNAIAIPNRSYGRHCFVEMLNELKEEHYPEAQKAANSNTPEAKILNDTYERFLISYEPVVGYYFRHLYNVVKFVDDHSDLLEEDTKRYTNLVRAQLSSYELGLLFYNCLSERGADFKEFVEAYALLEDISSTELIDEEHKKHYKESAFGESV